nr:MAG TPA: hypothetical protein [Caudoviricetes sp.]
MQLSSLHQVSFLLYICYITLLHFVLTHFLE